MGHLYFKNAYVKTDLFFGAQFLENSSLVGSGFEIALVTSQLNPRIPLFFVCLKEWRPLDNVSQLSPSRGLKG